MRVLIYGGGAVGLGVASCLIEAGSAVAILARPGTTQLLEREGLTRSGIFGEAYAPPGALRAFSHLSQVSGDPFDYVLVCTKSFDSPLVAQDLLDHAELLGYQGLIVLFQNGWGNAEAFSGFPGQVVYNARVITGFTRPQPNHVVVTVHADPIHVGSLYSPETAPVEALCQAISQGGIPCIAVSEIGKDLWAKMLFNCPLNAVGALLDVRYGVLGENPHTRRVMESIIAEVMAVMRAAGHATYWDTVDGYLDEFYAKSVPRTAEHYSSTLQDLRAGKRTEIDALNGAIVALGREHSIPTPANEMAYRLVKFLEERGTDSRG